MAVRRRTSRVSTDTSYQTYGSVAYAPAYSGAPERIPRWDEEFEQGGAQPGRRTRKLERKRVKVREAGTVSVPSVMLMVAVAVAAVLLLASYAQYLAVTTDIVSLRKEMTTLETEHETLAAEYERLFEMSSVEEQMDSEMVKPTSDQVVYIDLSEPDTVTLYGHTGENNPLLLILQQVGDALGGLADYFG